MMFKDLEYLVNLFVVVLILYVFLGSCRLFFVLLNSVGFLGKDVFFREVLDFSYKSLRLRIEIVW